MDTPRYYEMMGPVHSALRARGGTLTNKEIVDAVVEIMAIPENVFNGHRLGFMSDFESQLVMAKSYLKKAGYLTQSENGVWTLTPKGRDSETVDGLLIRTEVHRNYRKQRLGVDPGIPGFEIKSEDTGLEPEELVSDLWKQDLLGALQSMQPSAFERLCQRL